MRSRLIRWAEAAGWAAFVVALSWLLWQVDGDNPADWLIGFGTGVAIYEAIRLLGRGQ